MKEKEINKKAERSKLSLDRILFVNNCRDGKLI